MSRESDTTKPGGRRIRYVETALFLMLAVLLYFWLRSDSGETPSRLPGSDQQAGYSSGEASGSPKPSMVSSGKNSQDLPAAIARLASILMDENRSLEERGDAAYELAAFCQSASVNVLIGGLASGDASLRSVIARALGKCSHPDARAALYELLDDSDPLVVLGAIRAIAELGNLEGVDVLAGLLKDDQRSDAVRLAAAESLGQIPDPNALNVLAAALKETTTPDLAASILDGLGKRTFPEVEPLFRQYLGSPDLDVELRVAALEALAETPGDASSLLLEQAGHPDPDVREAAAWALSNAEEPGSKGEAVLQWLAREDSGAVRTKLYQALGNQSGIDPMNVLALIKEETEPVTQLAGWQWTASQLQNQSSAEITDYFHDTAMPQLKEMALSDSDFTRRLSSVMALSRADTPETKRVLEEIIRSSDDERVTKAARIGLY